MTDTRNLGGPALDALADRANSQHHAFETTQRDALAHAMAAGDALIEARQLVRSGGGRWLLWVKANCEFTDRTARRYMQIARNRPRVSDLRGVRAALAELAPRPRAFQVRGGVGPPVRTHENPNPARGLFTWMVPWRAECPCCGTVEVYPRPIADGEFGGPTGSGG